MNNSKSLYRDGSIRRIYLRDQKIAKVSLHRKNSMRFLDSTEYKIQDNAVEMLIELEAEDQI